MPSESAGEKSCTNTPDMTLQRAPGTATSALPSGGVYLRQYEERQLCADCLVYGVGGLALTPQSAESGIEKDLAVAMAAFGGRGVLSVRSCRAGALALAIVSDALVTNTVSESVENPMGAAGQTGRLRPMLEGSGSMPLATGGVLEPTLEAGLRYDGGDAESSAGLEIGG